MAIRRRFASVPPVFVSTKTSRSRSYEAMPSRAARHIMAYPASRADKLAYDSRAEDYLNNRVSNASFFSNYALEEGYDTARQSRNRDARLLRDATDAIVHSESFATPQTSVAARRVARGQSMAPPRATSVPPRPLYPLEAAIIASKMDADSFRGRRPRSEYAARKYRSMRLADQENIYAKSPQTAGYYASHPPLPKMTERKAIRTDEGYTKPKNILSWQSAPTSGSKTLSKVVVRRPGSVMEQVVTIPYETAKKRSRFLKRASSAPPVKYFPSPYDFPDPRLNVPKRGTISPLPKKSTEDGAEGERQRPTVKIPNYYAYGVDPANPPVSDLRKRIRKTLNKTRRSR